MRIRVALYARVSTLDGRQDCENQLIQLREFARRSDWEITTEYVEKESGRKAERPQLKQMFSDASQRRFDLLLFWSLDRLSREGALETLQYLNRLSDCGVGYRSFTEAYLDSLGPFGDAVIALLAAIARQEALRISERVRAGLARARETGTRSGRAIGRPRAVFRRDLVIELRNRGLSWREISKMTNGSIASVRRVYASSLVDIVELDLRHLASDLECLQ